MYSFANFHQIRPKRYILAWWVVVTGMWLALRRAVCRWHSLLIFFKFMAYFFNVAESKTEERPGGVVLHETMARQTPSYAGVTSPNVRMLSDSDKLDYLIDKRPVGLYSPLTAGIMTDFVIMIIILSSINKSVSQSLIIHDFIINYDKSSSMTLIIIHQSWSIIITKSSVMFLIIINQ